MGDESFLRQARWSAIGLILGAVLLGPFAPVIWALVIIDFFHAHEEVIPRILFLKQMAATLAAVPSGLLVFFLVGETMTDPGGVTGLLLIIAWALPAVVLVAVILTWPGPATYLVGLLTVGVVMIDLWYAVDADRWRAFEDGHGPVVAVVNFVVVALTMILAWRRPGIGGAFMLTVTLVVAGLAMFVDELIPAALASLLVGLVPGMLLVMATLVAHGAPNVHPMWNDGFSTRAGDGDDAEFRYDGGQRGRDVVGTAGSSGPSGPE